MIVSSLAVWPSDAFHEYPFSTLASQTAPDFPRALDVMCHLKLSEAQLD